MRTPEYHIHPVQRPPELQGLWNGPAWGAAPAAAVDHFRKESSAHRPRTQVKLLFDATGLYGLFRVQDNYVRCVHSSFLAPVYKDSCVEFFVQPAGARGYFNFEFNCGGALLASYIIDPTRTEDGFKQFTRLTAEQGRMVRSAHGLPSVVDPETAGEILWWLEFFIPVALLQCHAGPVKIIPGAIWRGNFYKCADESSHPHWAAWAPVDRLNFHLPHCFGRLHFSAR